MDSSSSRSSSSSVRFNRCLLSRRCRCGLVVVDATLELDLPLGRLVQHPDQNKADEGKDEAR